MAKSSPKEILDQQIERLNREAKAKGKLLEEPLDDKTQVVFFRKNPNKAIQDYQKTNRKSPSPNLLKVLLIVILVIGLIGVIFLLLKNKNTDKYKGDCVNYQDKQFFKKPIPIVWTAKFDGCLLSCWGAAFTRIPRDPKYPRFSGYVPDNGDRIADEYMKEGQILKIFGKWTNISDSYGFIFDNRCVPTVEIEKIEIIK